MLAAAIAVATGAVLAAAPIASADDSGWSASDGRVAVSGAGGTTTLVNADGSAAGTLTGTQPGWSPSGARAVTVVGGGLQTQRYDGTDVKALPAPLGGQAPTSPVYVYDGHAIVYADAGKLEVVESDADPAYYKPTYLLSSKLQGTGCDSQSTAALGDVLYFVRSTAACGQTGSLTGAIMKYDADAGTLTTVVANGSAPAVSPDGTKLVYTDAQGRLTVSGSDGSNPQSLTDGNTAYTSYAWEPGQINEILAQSAGGGVLIDAVNGNVGDQVAPAGTSVAWQPLRQIYVPRVYGSSHQATGIAASKWSWNTVGKSTPGLVNAGSAVIIGAGSSSYGSLAPALADKKNGPVLTNYSTTGLDSGLQSELTRILPKGKTVYVLGGTNLVNSSAASKLTSLGYKVDRVNGSTRYTESVDIAKAITSAPKTVFLATAQDYHSLLSSEAAAGSDGTSSTAVVLGTDNSTMTESVYSYLNTINPKTTAIVAVGGTAQTALINAYNDNHLPKWGTAGFSYYPVSGSGYSGTSTALAKLWWSSPGNVTLVPSASWTVGIDGTSAMAPFGPVLWTSSTSLDATDQQYLWDNSGAVETASLFGDTTDISWNAMMSTGRAAAVTGSWTYLDADNGQLPAGSPTAAPMLASGVQQPPATAGRAAAPATRQHDLGTPHIAH